MIRWLATAVLLPALCWGQDELNSESGLVGRWLVPGWQTVNGAAPTLTIDLTGVANGTTTGGPSWKLDGNRSGLSSDATNKYTKIGKPASLTNLTDTASFSFWSYLYRTNQDHIIMSDFNSGAGNSRFTLTFRNYNIRIIRANLGAYEIYTVTNGVPSTNSWNHYAVTITNHTFAVYVNGVYQTKTGKTGSVGITTQNGNWFISTGGDYHALDSQYLGSLFDLRVYNRVLSASEVNAIYQQGLAPK